MSENTQPPQKLRDALIAEGKQEQANLLTEETANLTRNDFINILNTGDWGDISEGGILVLRKLFVMRIKSGQPVFPWNDQEFLNAIYDDIIGLVY